MAGPETPQAEAAWRSRVVAAAGVSHRSWNATRAARAGGWSRALAGGLLAYTPGPDGPGGLQVLFTAPAQAAAAAAEVLAKAARLGGLREIGWWAADADQNGDVAPRLLARGFQWGWQPHWMGLDAAAGTSEVPAPPGIAIRDAGPRDAPPCTAVLTALEGEAEVGRVTLHACADPGGGAPLGGIYDCAVVPRARRRGIGTALSAAAVARARAWGCGLVTLNATAAGQPVYRRVGFRSAGWGQTWWMLRHQLEAPPPSAVAVRLVEAIGRDDLPALDEAVAAAGAPGLDATLTCGLTPLGVAVLLGCAAAADRLVALGAFLDVVSAWDLGWRDRAAALLAARPELANHGAGDHGATPLHTAVERDDEALARLVLSAHPDLTLQDRTFGSDALGWAAHFQREHLAALIRAAGAP